MRRKRRPQYGYTLSDLARASGYHEQTVKNRRDNNPYDTLEGAARVVLRGQHRYRFSPLTAEELQEAFGEELIERWVKRFPLVLLYACPECPQPDTHLALLFEPTFCFEHGGPFKPSLCWTPNGYIGIRTEKGVEPWHHLLLKPKRGYACTHIDGNPWNNRPGNLTLEPDP